MLELSHGLRETRVYQDARQEGREEGLKESLVEILSARFGIVSEAISGQLAATTDVTMLKDWLRQAIVVSKIAEFAQQLEHPSPEPGNSP